MSNEHGRESKAAAEKPEGASSLQRYVVMKVPTGGECVGSVQPGDLAVVDQGLAGTDGATVVFRDERGPVFGECVVRDGAWYVRDASGALRDAAALVRDGAVYGGSVHYVVRPGKRTGRS